MENNQILTKTPWNTQAIQLRTGFLQKAPTRKDACLTKQLNYLNLFSHPHSFKISNAVITASKFGIRVEDDTIMTLWVLAR